MPVRVGPGLELEEFAAEGARVDGKVALWWRTLGKRFGEEVVVRSGRGGPAVGIGVVVVVEAARGGCERRS